jgi:hypothetical protein
VTRRLPPAVATLGLLAAACGNFFPDPDNVVLPSGALSYELVCGRVPRAECVRRAEALVEQARTEHRGVRVTKILLHGNGGYTVTFSDGNSESLIVN